jgi:hypothetical protein
MFVRDPHSRILSGYVDKLYCPNTLYWKVTGRYVVSDIRENGDALLNKLRIKVDPTFWI